MLNSFVSSLFNLLCFLTQCEKAMCHCWYKCGMLQFFKCSYVGSGNHFTAVNVGMVRCLHCLTCTIPVLRVADRAFKGQFRIEYCFKLSSEGSLDE